MDLGYEIWVHGGSSESNNKANGNPVVVAIAFPRINLVNAAIVPSSAGGASSCSVRTGELGTGLHRVRPCGDFLPGGDDGDYNPRAGVTATEPRNV